MPSKPPIQYRVAVVLTVINVLGLGYAVGTGEAAHAMVHCVLTVVFGSWARRLGQNPVASELQPAREELERLEALEAESSRLQLELGEMQERLDFVERMLAQGPEPRRMGS